MVPGTVTPEPSPQSPPAENPSRKRKYFDEKLIDSSCFKIRALLRQLRPQVIDVLRTSDFRNCRAAYEVKMQMKLLMDLYRQMTSDIKPLDKVASESHPLSSENVLQKQPWHGKEDVTLREQVQPEQSMEESSEKEHPPSSNSSVKLDDSYIRGSYIVGGSAFGWNFITCSGSMPVYYGVTKEAYRNASKMSRIGAQGIGLNYGLLGDNLPPPDQVVTLLKSKNIQKIRLFDPNPIVLNALGNSGIETVVGVPNQDLPELAGDYNFATQWVATNVIPYIPAVKFRYIAAGNEVIPGPLAQYVFDAMNHLDIALKKENINIPVTIVIHTAVIGPSFPPSNGVFSEVALSAMRLIIPFLVTNQYPLLYNPYPYFAYAGDPEHVPVSYALGNATGSEVVHDGDLQYNSLFDAMIDTIYAAAEKVGGEALRIVVAETGWPSARNGDKTTIPIAQAYVNNVIDRVNSQSGTPRKPGIPLEAYIYSIFNENQKPAGVEQNFGLFYPDMSPVYSVKLPV